ncbi:hypothetical protein DH2020_047684 [Rehmannia glutinosa]|uniref:F-box/LRR-repeat protein 15/At3g58940/PEG3-like LRR domain-containing protein n=1 Tax=Rehmannia glutinosa TaxID=99300 RepID=A0ABR0U8P3_REHGL
MGYTTIQYSRKKKVSEIDRLSGLPDNVLIRILSFLPTKLSVATAILGKRWRFLWAHVPNFDFDGETHSPESTMNFSDTINRVMLLSKVQTINTFRLSCFDKCRECEIETWLAAAIARNVQKFDLYIRCHDGFFAGLPRCVFTCKTLVDLRLHGCDLGFICCGLIISLPSLRKLQFSSVQFGCSDEALPRLLSGCPVLEELIIDGIVDRFLKCYIISSSSIKKLILDLKFDTTCVFDSSSSAYKVEINAPLLRYFQLQDCSGMSDCFSEHTLASLIEADISFNNSKVAGEHHLYTLSVLEKIDLLCNVKYLKLSSGMVFNFRAFGDRSKSIMSFDSLIKLELGAHWLFLTKFLESADNLQVLIVREVDACLKHWMEPKEVPKSLLSHLTIIRIEGMGYTQQEFDMFLRTVTESEPGRPGPPQCLELPEHES